MKMCRTDNFKPVEVAKSFLGIKKGTILKFDEHSSRYISRSGEEEISDNEYYYSGSAVELDPLVVENNIGKYFKYLELPAAKPIQPLEDKKEVSIANPVSAEPVVEEQEPVTEGPKLDSEAAELAEAEKPIEFNLVFECGLCHYENKIAPVRYGIFLPASEEVSLTMTCENCGTITKLYYTKVDNETTEKSKSV